MFRSRYAQIRFPKAYIKAIVFTLPPPPLSLSYSSDSHVWKHTLSRIKLNYSNKPIFWLIFASVVFLLLLFGYLLVGMCSHSSFALRIHENEMREKEHEICTTNTFTVKPIKHGRPSEHIPRRQCIGTCNTRWHVSRVTRAHALMALLFGHKYIVLFNVCCPSLHLHSCFDTYSHCYPRAIKINWLTDIDVCMNVRVLSFHK